jgi:hypothetical protein
MQGERIMSNDCNDFGFCAVDENELRSVQRAAQEADKASTTAVDLNMRLDRMYNAIVPLLNNLKADPGREYILWPNRADKIEQFEKKLLDIYNGVDQD